MAASAHVPATDPGSAWTEPAGCAPLSGCSSPSSSCPTSVIDSVHGKEDHDALLEGGCGAGGGEPSPSLRSDEGPLHTRLAPRGQRRSSRTPLSRQAAPLGSFHTDQKLQTFFAVEAQATGLLCLRMRRGSGREGRAHSAREQGTRRVLVSVL